MAGVHLCHEDQLTRAALYKQQQNFLVLRQAHAVTKEIIQVLHIV
jgi:hypothetical protein